MLVSRKWLEEYLDLSKYSDDDLYNIFTAHVCEVELMYKTCGAEHMTVAKVLTCEDIPDTHLHKCSVEVRPGEVTQIVCGAPNVSAGKLVIAANPGAILPGNFKIKASKIRGIESNGMLCSLQELGVEEKYVPEQYKNGIYLFERGDVKVGDNPLEYLGINDTIYELAVTSNRSDLLSIEGVLYDLAAAINQKFTKPLKEVKEEIENNTSIEVLTDNCYKYATRVIEGVTVSESPMWLKKKLVASGIRPINNVVDVTNYVLMLLGQPLHSFDKDKLGNKISVRQALDNELITTLDEQERKLTSDDIVITNGKDALCVAGVMGGLTTEVTNETKNVTLEAAYFDFLSIRKTSSRLGLKSESSSRFEHKIDYERVERALDYASVMIKELAGGMISNMKEVIKKELKTSSVSITTSKVNNYLGTNLTTDYLTDLFNRLSFEFKVNNDEFEINLPSRRMDLEPSFQDICEDVARMYGYDNIPTTIAEMSSRGGLTEKQKKIRTIRQFLSTVAFNEIVSYSLIKECDLYNYVFEEKAPIKPLMPLTDEHAVMRQSLLNGVVDAIQYNLARKNQNLALFEIGNVYYDGGKPEDNQSLHLAMALNGLYESSMWEGERKVSSFYVLKGLLDSLLTRLGVEVTYSPYDGIKSFHPGRTAEIKLHNERIGIIGELHPKFAKEHDVKGTIALEIDLTKIVEGQKKMKYHSINKFPSINRDLAIVVKDEVKASDIIELVKKTGRKYITKVEVFDVYKGENVLEDEKSIAFTMTFEDFTKTLESEEVDNEVKKILDKLTEKFNAKIRQ